MSYQQLKYYHQLGHQDQIRNLELLTSGIGQGAILSLRHLTSTKLNEYASRYSKTGAELFLDPQYYNPRNPIKDTLPSIQNSYDLSNESVSKDIIRQSLNLQKSLNVSHYIIPAPLIETLSSDNLNMLDVFSKHGRIWLDEFKEFDKELYLTLAVGKQIIASNSSYLSLLNSIAGNKFVNGFYICITDLEEQLSDTRLLLNILDTVFLLKRNKFKVILAFSSYWIILTFPLGLDAFASGGWGNRRQFQSIEWVPSDGDSTKRRGKDSYWSPQLMSRIVFPDEAELLYGYDIWNDFDIDSPYAELFSGIAPAIIAETEMWSMTDSFKHYSWTMAKFANDFCEMTLSERMGHVRFILDTALNRQHQIEQLGIPLRHLNRNLPVWKNTFNEYINRNYIDLCDEFE